MANRLVSLGDLTLDATPMLDRVPLAAQLGYDAIGFRTVPIVGSDRPVVQSGTRLMRTIKEQLNDTSLVVLDAEAMRFGQHDEVPDAAPYLDSAAELGARNFLVVSHFDDERRSADALAAICDEAAGYGLFVVLEYMVYLAHGSLAKADRTITTAGCPNAGVLIDTLHFCRAGDDPATIALIAPERLPYIQLSDAAERPADWRGDHAGALRDEAMNRRFLPGDGTLALPSILAALPRSTAISIEIPASRSYPGVPDAEIARRALSATRAMLAALPLDDVPRG
ncbi:MAG: xylose isomerase domain protein barrel [Microbacteriaceae bacterium]|nr:xylose isomerase domain protein barrel [Microbacteriaceae bacterium]